MPLVNTLLIMVLNTMHFASEKDKLSMKLSKKIHITTH